MALDYKVVRNKSEYNVIETSTEQTIKSFNDQNDAKKLMKHLNLGGGFAGWTPSFILKRAKIKNN